MTKIEVGKCYDCPSGLSVRVLDIEQKAGSYWRARLENLNGKRPGFKHWQNHGWLEVNATPSIAYR